ncbi:MAG: sulfatase-like hydrolase/transferase [Planctomycetota bacterium]|jgi:arylsulfatase A-like enzyme|nr:sulfatase-like hydrolase/transferase [Planctomycetota bacterium]
MIRQRQAELILFFALSSGLVDAEQAHPRPNILVIISDDQGWADVGYHGSEILTPNIDRLAKEGLVLDQHYVTPMCSSTRACLLSGRYSTRFGLDGATNSQVFPFGTITLASALKGLGYDTGITGKWHLGSMPQAGPFKFGFNRSYGSFAGGVDQYTHLYKKGKFSNTWHRNDQYVEEEGHATDLIAREAIRWIEAKGEAPFYIQVAFTAVHVPIQEPKEWVKPYAGKIENESRRRYAACATHMDDAIGQMLSALKRTGQWENTMVLFTSDNGGSGGWRPTGKYPGKYEASPVLGNNLPLRGRKGSVYEGGIRVPACISWPGVLKPGKVTEPIHIVDWMPTLLSLLSYKVEEDLGWDGMNVWPLLTGKQAELEDREFYFKRGSSTALRYGDWKLVQSGRRQELFNLANDPNEKSNVAPEQKELVALLSGRLNRQRARDK